MIVFAARNHQSMKLVTLCLIVVMFLGGRASAQLCNICGDGMYASALNGSISIEGFVDLATCEELVAAAAVGEITTVGGVCERVQGLVREAETCGCTPFVCDICGEGLDVLNPDGVVEFPQGTLKTCFQLLADARGGQIDPESCNELTSLAQDSCECGTPTDAPTTSLSPSIAPSPKPTFGPPPDCYTDLDELFEREFAVEDVDIPRTYILCPNTDFVMGRSNENGPGYVGGFTPLTPRSNAVYKCGEDGSSTNNCTLIDGSFQLVSFAKSFEEEQVNVTYQGFTFEAGFEGSLLFSNPGEITFLDCIMRNHKNVGPVIVLHDSQFARRLKEISSGNHHEDVRRLTEMISNGEYDEHVRRLQEEGAASARELQEENPDVLYTLTLKFINCLFEGNQGVPLEGPIVRPGVITVQFPENTLVIDNTVFRDNDFGRLSVQPTGWAIRTAGPLTVKNTCFFDNNFRREAPVVVLNDQYVEASNNFGTEDDDVECQFIAEFPYEELLETLSNYTCIEYDVDQCQATVHLPAETDSPVPSPTITPVAPPTPSRSGAVAKVGYELLTWMFASVFGVAIML